MKLKTTILTIILLFVSGFPVLRAQSAVPASAGNATGDGGSVSYSVGQVVYSTYSGTNGSVAQGVQQPYEISVITGTEEGKSISLELAVYPNPVKDILTLKIDNEEMKQFTISLYDFGGNLLETKEIESDLTRIDMSAYSSGSYILRVLRSDKIVKVFKIIKN